MIGEMTWRKCRWAFIRKLNRINTHRFTTKSEKRAKVHQRGDRFNLAGKQVAEQQGDAAGKQNGIIRRFTRGMDVSEKAGNIRSRPIENSTLDTAVCAVIMLPTAHTNATMMENATLSQIPPTLPAMVKNASFVALPSAKRSTLPVANAANATTIINSTVAKTNANSVALLTARPRLRFLHLMY